MSWDWYVAVCCSVCCIVWQCVEVRCSVLQCVAVCYSVLQCVALLDKSQKLEFRECERAADGLLPRISEIYGAKVRKCHCWPSPQNFWKLCWFIEDSKYNGVQLMFAKKARFVRLRQSRRRNKSAPKITHHLK